MDVTDIANGMGSTFIDAAKEDAVNEYGDMLNDKVAKKIDPDNKKEVDWTHILAPVSQKMRDSCLVMTF